MQGVQGLHKFVCEILCSEITGKSIVQQKREVGLFVHVCPANCHPYTVGFGTAIPTSLNKCCSMMVCGGLYTSTLKEDALSCKLPSDTS